MPNVFHIKGEAAELRWGYAKAATLRGWAVAGEPGAWTFTATIVDQDDFTVSQRPLQVVTTNGWRWLVDPESLQIAGLTVTASVRPHEVSDATLSHRPA